MDCRLRRAVTGFFVFLLSVATATAAQERAVAAAKTPSIEEKTSGMRKLDGFFPLYWDEPTGTLYIEIPRFDTELLYVNWLSSGLGSNDIGLDRGQLGGSRIVRFERIGPKVLMVQPNYGFRATSANPDERRAVEEAFARSVLWGFSVSAQSGNRVLVDATDFLLRDAHGVIQRLRPAQYRLERPRSAVSMDRTRAFPKNTEMDAILTFATDGDIRGAGGGFERGSIDAVAANAQSFTVNQHHSFVELPDGNYKPRRFDPRAGFNAISYVDYAAPLGEPMTTRFILRHRLQKKAPTERVSDPVKPIVYYLDRGTPEPVRSALLDGARWWNQAFEAAGYRNAFQVEMMPSDADPLDVRYNVIQWVHRSTRGWSYGASVVDPRTGEIIKGHVTLGSLRVRQDYMIAEGLLSPYKEGTEKPTEPAEMALARLRQLSAHEIGHTIGLAHNYYDSERGRISVLDYPHPLVKLTADGTIDLSDAYAVGIGEWDKVAIAWGYQDLAPDIPEEQTLDSILTAAWARDLRFMTDQDVGINPRIDRWANGTDPSAELKRTMQVRRAALNRFGENAIRRGMPLATMEEVLVPLYLHHRYQVEATASAIGGVHYSYAVRGDNRDPVTPVPAAEQRAALDALTATLKPAELVLPAAVLDKLPPRPFGSARHRELFPRHTGSGFDPLTPAVVAADLTLSVILQPDRAARLIAQHALDPSLFDLQNVLDQLHKATFDVSTTNAYEAEVSRAVERVFVDRLIALSTTAQMPQVRAIATRKLAEIMSRARTAAGGRGDDADIAHNALVAADIKRSLERPAEPAQPPSIPAAPPGAPIGEPAQTWLERMEPPCSWPSAN